MKSSQSTRLILNGVTAGQLQKWLAKRPEDARLSFSHTPADRPGIDSSYDTITATWEEEE